MERLFLTALCRKIKVLRWSDPVMLGYAYPLSSIASPVFFLGVPRKGVLKRIVAVQFCIYLRLSAFIGGSARTVSREIVRS